MAFSGAKMFVSGRGEGDPDISFLLMINTSKGPSLLPCRTCARHYPSPKKLPSKAWQAPHWSDFWLACPQHPWKPQEMKVLNKTWKIHRFSGEFLKKIIISKGHLGKSITYQKPVHQKPSEFTPRQSKREQKPPPGHHHPGPTDSNIQVTLRCKWRLEAKEGHFHTGFPARIGTDAWLAKKKVFTEFTPGKMSEMTTTNPSNTPIRRPQKTPKKNTKKRHDSWVGFGNDLYRSRGDWKHAFFRKRWGKKKHTNGWKGRPLKGRCLPYLEIISIKCGPVGFEGLSAETGTIQTL